MIVVTFESVYTANNYEQSFLSLYFYVFIKILHYMQVIIFYFLLLYYIIIILYYYVIILLYYYYI